MKSFTEQNSDRQSLATLLPLRQPLSLCIEPTALCNFKCPFCARSHPNFLNYCKPPRTMPWKLFSKIINSIKDAGWVLQKVNLYGDGEPLLHKQIDKMAEKCIEIGYPVVITTNGSLITENLAEKLVKSGLHYIRISVYGINKEKHTAAIGKGVPSPESIRDRVKLLKCTRDKLYSPTPYIYVKMIDQQDQGENESFFHFYKDIADQTNLESPMNWNGFNGIDFIKKLDPEADQCKVQNFYTAGGERIEGKKTCTIPFHAMNIKSNGDVVACIVDWNRGTCIGNVTDTSLQKIWNGERARRLRRLLLEGRDSELPSCKDCKNRFANPESIDSLPLEKFDGMI